MVNTLLFDGQFVVFLRKRRKVYPKINMWPHELYSGLRCSCGGGGWGTKGASEILDSDRGPFLH